MYDDENFTRCQICGERFSALDKEQNRAEMYDPTKDDQSYVCHAECGLARDWEVA